MLSEKMEKAFNDQLNAEMYSFWLYLSMASYFKSINLDGFANWMRVQADEEQFHAMKFYEFIISRGGRVLLGSIAAPPTQWGNPLEVFEEALSHERKVTGMINDLVELAATDKDHASNVFLHWFVTEQVEEEEHADGVVQQLKLIGDDKGGLFMIDRELAGRKPGTDTGSSE